MFILNCKYHLIITRFGSNRIHSVGMSANGKRRYESGAKKRADKRRKEEAASGNTKSIGSFFQKSLDSSTVDNTMASILSTGSKMNESEQTQEINCNESQEFCQDKEEPITCMNQVEVTESSSPNEPEIFDLSRENPTDRGHFDEDINSTEKEHYSTWPL